MSIPTSFNPLGAMGIPSDIEIINQPTYFGKKIIGVPVDGVTSASCENFRVRARFDLTYVDIYRTFFFLFDLWGQNTNGRFLFCTNSSKREMTSEINGAWANSYNIKATGNILDMNYDRFVLNGDESLYAGGRKQNEYPVRPTFFSVSSDNPFKLESFVLEINGVVRQHYVPARRNGVLGLYEKVSKTFCE